MRTLTMGEQIITRSHEFLLPQYFVETWAHQKHNKVTHLSWKLFHDMNKSFSYLIINK